MGKLHQRSTISFNTFDSFIYWIVHRPLNPCSWKFQESAQSQWRAAEDIKMVSSVRPRNIWVITGSKLLIPHKGKMRPKLTQSISDQTGIKNALDFWLLVICCGTPSQHHPDVLACQTPAPSHSVLTLFFPTVPESLGLWSAEWVSLEKNQIMALGFHEPLQKHYSSIGSEFSLLRGHNKDS